MGHIVEADDTPHGIDFEVRSKSVIFFEPLHILGGCCEISKAYLTKLRGLLNDPGWQEQLLSAQQAAEERRQGQALQTEDADRPAAP